MPVSSSWTFEAWIAPLEDAVISTEQQIFYFIEKDSATPSFEAYLGPNCKCVTVRLNGNPASTTASPSIPVLNIPMFLGISLSANGQDTDVRIDFGG